MVTALDDVVGNITKCLKDQQMYKNTIIIFSSDNGGIKQNKEGNWPLKGDYIKLILQIFWHLKQRVILNWFYLQRRQGTSVWRWYSCSRIPPFLTIATQRIYQYRLDSYYRLVSHLATNSWNRKRSSKCFSSQHGWNRSTFRVFCSEQGAGSKVKSLSLQLYVQGIYHHYNSRCCRVLGHLFHCFHF